ncbi:hypothetical protein DQK91_05325 [Oceanidesulfovibrio marinus]|uniref:Uncharacterized protein n=1 Tax=Oceanidesulfovibrio marinus TaxID=370038 RepID=A0A6P1ZNX7_9BACT|nr:hypothetical protein DQK91_05325 [Oceanidesulfovibrio marinus]
MTTVHVFDEDVLLFVCISTILLGNDRKLRGRPDQHLYVLFLQLECIAHRTMQIAEQRFCGMVPRRLLDEHFRIKDHGMTQCALSSIPGMTS